MRYQKFGSGVLLICPKTNRILLVLRNDYTPTWAVLGGMVETMEHPIQCAKRELLEEAKFYEGIDFKLKDVNPLYIFSNPNFVYYTYLGIMDLERLPSLNYENIRGEWVTLDDIPTPLHFGVDLILRDPSALERIRKEFEPNSAEIPEVESISLPSSGN
jgi:8-oxo-dGTP pyrophosphatase MutT (NUDIX family)